MVLEPPRPEKSPKTQKFTKSQKPQNGQKWVISGKIERTEWEKVGKMKNIFDLGSETWQKWQKMKNFEKLPF